MKSQKLINILAALFGVFVPISTKTANIIIAFFIALCLYFIKVNNIKLTKPCIKIFISTTLFIFLLICIGGFINPSGFIKYFGRYISYFLIPITLINLSKPVLNKIINYSLNGLIIGLLITTIVLQINTFLSIVETNSLNFKTYFNYFHTHFYFTQLLKIHPVYLGMYYMLGINFILYSFLFLKQNIRKKIILFLCVLLFSFTLLSLNSRIIFGIFCITSFVYFIYWFIKTNTSRKIISFSVFLLLLLNGIKFIENTYIYDRLTNELEWELTNQIDTKFNSKISSDSRMARWIVSIKAIKEKAILGRGTDSEKQALAEAFDENGLTTAANMRYDAHNQFLSFGIEFGILGITLFIIYLSTSFFYAYKSNKKLLFILFFVSILATCVTENLFKNNAGILFIAFFANLFTIYTIKNRNETIQRI